MESLTWKDNGTVITFNRKPTPEIIACLKAHGLRWSPGGGYWYHPRRNYITADCVAGISKLCDKANGVRRPDGQCWTCGDPNGFFRAYGAATPVYCDKCQAERQTQEPKYV